MIYIKNSTEIQKIYIPKNDGMPCTSSHKGSGYDEGYHDGYVDGVGDGEQAIIATFTSATITENGEYGSSASPYSSVTVSIDTASTYNEGYESGVTDGEQNIINTFTSDTLTVNGTYGSSAHPYSSVTVDVDLDAPYESGYTDGYASGWSSGYSSGYSSGETAGYDDGYDSGYTSGMSSGYSKGWSEGFPEGQQDIINTFTSETLTVNGTYGSSAHPYSSVTVDVDMDAPYESGYTDGYESGYTSGYSSGYTSGETAGYDSGYSEGYESGYSSGSDVGYQEGYESGYTSGETAGYDSGFTSGYSEGYDSGFTSGETVGEQNIIDTFTAMTANTNGVYGSSAQPLSSITVDVPTGETYNIEEAKQFTATTNGNYTIVPSIATTVVNERYDNDEERYYITATTSNYPSTGYFELLKVEDEFDDSKGYIEIYLYDGRIDYDASSWHGGEVYEWGTVTTRNEIELYIKNANRDFTWTRLGDYSMVYDLMSSVTLTVDVDTASTYNDGYVSGMTDGYQSGMADGEQNIIGTFTADTATTNGVYGSSAHPLSSITVSIPVHSSTTEYDYNTIYAKYNFASSGSKPILSHTYYVQEMYVDGSSASEVPSTTRNFSAGEHSIAFVGEDPNHLSKYCFYMSGTELTELVVGKAFTMLSDYYGGALTNCTKLSAMTLLYDGVVSISSGQVATFANNGVMYVPASQMTAYVQSQNWSYLFTNKGWTIEMIEDTQVAYNEGFDDGLGVGYESGASSVNLGQKTITANGTYRASDDGYDGYDMIEVNVPSSSGGGVSYADGAIFAKNLRWTTDIQLQENYIMSATHVTMKSVVGKPDDQGGYLFSATTELPSEYGLTTNDYGLHLENGIAYVTPDLVELDNATLGMYSGGTFVNNVQVGYDSSMINAISYLRLFNFAEVEDTDTGEIGMGIGTIYVWSGTPLDDSNLVARLVPQPDGSFYNTVTGARIQYETLEYVPNTGFTYVNYDCEGQYQSGVTDGEQNIIDTFTAMTVSRNGVYGSSAHPLSAVTVALPFTSATFTGNGTYYAQNGDATFLDYIETDGHDILFDTGVKMTSTGQTVILDFMPLTGSIQYDAFLTYMSQQDNDSKWQLGLRQGSVGINNPSGEYWYTYRDSMTEIAGLFSADTRAYVVMGYTGITVNGISSASTHGNLTQTDSNIVLNGQYAGNENYRCPYARYYGFKLIDDDGVTALADLRPALDGNIPCFYDMVSGNFIHQFGTGHTSSGSVISYRVEGFTAVTVDVDTASTYQSGYTSGYTDGYNDGSQGGNQALIDYIEGDLTHIDIPSGCTDIRGYAFSGMTSLSSVTIPDSVTHIGWYSFQNCTGLTNIVIGNSVTLIASYVFSGCTSLTDIAIPNSVTGLGSYAFNRCTNMTAATIGSGITTIPIRTFEGDTKLKQITFRNPTPPTSLGTSAFPSGTTYVTGGTMYVPSGSYQDYYDWTRNNTTAKRSFSGWTVTEYTLGQ